MNNGSIGGFRGFGGFNSANSAALLEQQLASRENTLSLLGGSGGSVGSVGFGGFNSANSSAILQQQLSDQQNTQNILRSIGHVPQGGAVNTHGDVNRAVSLGGAKTSIEGGFENHYLLGAYSQSRQPAWIKTVGAESLFAPQQSANAGGLGVDLNGDGQFQSGTDGHLALDLDGNGLYNQDDIKDTLRMLQLFSGDSKTASQTGFGGFNQADQAKTLLLKARGTQADLNKDGVLSGWELNKMGAKVLVGEQNGGPALRAHSVPGAYSPDYNPQSSYYPQSSALGGQSPYGAPMNYGPPAYFMQVLSSFMSLFARPY